MVIGIIRLQARIVTPSEVSHVNEIAEQVLSPHEMVRLEKIKIEPLHKTIVTKITLNFNEQVQ